MIDMSGPAGDQPPKNDFMKIRLFVLIWVIVSVATILIVVVKGC